MKKKYQLSAMVNELSMKISIKSGNIQIVAQDDRQDIEVDIPELRKNSIDELYKLGFENNKLIISEKKPEKLFQFMNFPGALYEKNIFIKIPKRMDCKGQIVLYNGDIVMENTKFSGSTKAYNGDLSLKNVSAGKVTMNSYNGDVKASDFRGELNISQYNGDVNVNNSEIQGLAIKNYCGDITINAGFDLREKGKINSISGDIDINFDKFEGDKELGLSTLTGDIDLKGNYPEEKILINKRMNFEGKEFFKGFKPMMKNIFSSFNSDKDNIEVEVETRGEEKTDDNIEKILNMVTEGKITADQAEALITALG